ncbi:hypothetical protein BJ742DRAFT_532129 [Cladochytrium replicatum]|nr:hypothetical protein BJ742DRAFT_532129 [Cladochytrium replicatum]
MYSKILSWVGANNNQRQAIGSDVLAGTSGERFFGLENFGNTCYCNSVLQALYFCKPFRDCLLTYNYPSSAILTAAAAESISLFPPNVPSSPLSANQNLKPSPSGISLASKNANSASMTLNRSGLGSASVMGTISRRESNAAKFPPQSPTMSPAAAFDGFEPSSIGEDTLLSHLQDLFAKVATQKKRTGTIAPTAFIQKVKKENELFRSTMHQDAHEFFNYLLNEIAETLLSHQKEFREKLRKMYPQTNAGDSSAGPKSSGPPPATWIHSLFEGTLTNETKCLTCETVTNRDESFLDLSVDIEPNTSITSCLRSFSGSETLCQRNKFYCEQCRSLQEAQRSMKVKKLPNILAVHLKRFKYQEKVQRNIKLSYRVLFPMELRLFNTADGTADDMQYSLFAVIVHIGSGPHHGHYVSLVKAQDHWVLFDDEHVEAVDESELGRYFGDSTSMGTGYIFLYQVCHERLKTLLSILTDLRTTNSTLPRS